MERNAPGTEVLQGVAISRWFIGAHKNRLRFLFTGELRLSEWTFCMFIEY